MSRDVVIRNILAEVREDYLGLYDIVWDLRTTSCPMPTIWR